MSLARYGDRVMEGVHVAAANTMGKRKGWRDKTEKRNDHSKSRSRSNTEHD